MQLNQNNVVNANIGITNIIEKDEIRDTMMKTFIELADKLKAHCGPYSGTAILTNPSNMMAEPVFTKDGINIVRSIKYASPMQDFVRQQLAYMGSRVERSAGDGTTSTMIIMAYTLANLLEYFKSTEFKYTNADLSYVWNTLVSEIVKQYSFYTDYARSLNDPETVNYVAASQAYTSSHGDVELAKCIGTLFGNTPRLVWDTLTIQKAIYETEEKYKVNVQEADYVLDGVRLFPNDKCDKELGTALDEKNIECFLCNYIAIGDDSQKDLHKFIENRITSGVPTIIICDDSMDAYTIDHYQKLFFDNPNHRTIFVMCHSDDAVLNDIGALHVLMRERLGEPDAVPMFKADITFKGSTFTFVNGIYENRLESGVSPYYNNPDHPIFNEFVDTVKTIINKEKMDVTRSNEKVIINFTKILHKLLSTKYVTFVVGGAAYDNAAAQDIAMDALLATKCSLTKGFVAGRCVTLKKILENFLDASVPVFGRQKMTCLYKAYIKALLKGITEVDKALVDNVGQSSNITLALSCAYSPADFTRLDDPSYTVPTSLETALDAKKDYCILEPVETDLTFVKRFGELGLKFLTATRVITDGFMYDNENEEKK